MRDHESIGLFLGNGLLFVGNLALSVFGLFLFCFLFSVRRTSPRHTGFWLAIKGRGPLQVMVSFLGDNSVLFRYFCFLLIFDREFSFFCFLSIFVDWEFSPFAFFRFFDWELFFLCFLPRASFTVSWNFGPRLVEWLDMIYVRVWFGSGIKGMSHIISMIHMQQ